MTHDFPVNPLLSSRPAAPSGARLLVTAAELRAHGVTSAQAGARCRPGGSWQRLLPGVYLLRQGAPTGEERLHAALLYASRRESAASSPGEGREATAVPVQPRRDDPPHADAVVTGLAALALRGFSSAPALSRLDAVDVLVPRARRVRSTGCARVVRTARMPVPEAVAGVPAAPVERAVADAVAHLPEDAGALTVRRLFGEAVQDGHCEPAALLRELRRGRLTGRPRVAEAMDVLVAQGRAAAEERLYRMAREHGLPDPVWNVELRLPDGPSLGAVDAYWPERAVAVELEAPGDAGKRERLERLGVTVVRVPRLRLTTDQGMEHQAALVRTALTAALDHRPASPLRILPR
ncbi:MULTISPECIES: hypothetical protein [Streptomyces]|uniref:DUF559 domain-containing protein n=1 Tax=Streptomyces chilikensis TaxID=1194079 RepID=A0ABV3EY54_9ACTN|nr:hypothetical protein [Streptomyces sp. MJP52]MDH6226962.1 hypothetical protein [Streptomyces sp. MJP52]